MYEIVLTVQDIPNIFDIIMHITLLVNLYWKVRIKGIKERKEKEKRKRNYKNSGN